MHVSTRWILALALCSAPEMGLAVPASSPPAPAGEAAIPTGAGATIKRPSWGKVVGWVVDASTRKPVRQAAVSLEVEGAFPASGRSTGQTDAAGRFTTRAPLGKISSNLDWGRVLTMHPFSLLF